MCSTQTTQDPNPCFPHPNPILLPLFIMWCPLLFFLLHLFARFTCYGLYQRMKETEGVRLEYTNFSLSCSRKMKGGWERWWIEREVSVQTRVIISGIKLSGSALFASQPQVLRNGYRRALETRRGNTASPSPSFITSWSDGLINNQGLILCIQRLPLPKIIIFLITQAEW